MTSPSCRSYLSCNLLISSRYLLGILCGTVFSLTSGQSLTWRSSIELSFLPDNIIFFAFIHISSFRGIWTAKQTFFRKVHIWKYWELFDFRIKCDESCYWLFIIILAYEERNRWDTNLSSWYAKKQSCLLSKRDISYFVNVQE